jgi:hypothetical protein
MRQEGPDMRDTDVQQEINRMTTGWRKRQIDDDIQDYVRPWRGLTDEEIEACFEFIIEEDWQAIRFARLIETKLKEKNHG